MARRPVWAGVVSVAAAASVWEIACRAGWLNTVILPPPSEVLRTLARLLASGELLIDAGTSLWRVFVGFLVAAVLGVSGGTAVALSGRFRAYAAPLLELIRPVPPVAFVPISVLWFGIGNGPAFFLVALGAFFPIFTNTVAGMLALNPLHRDAALCLGAGRALMLTDVQWPAAMPYLLAGLKTGLGTAWFCVIVAELVGAQSGLGYMIQLNRLTLQSEKVLAGMVMIGCLGYLMNRAMVELHRRAVRWQVTSLHS